MEMGIEQIIKHIDRIIIGGSGVMHERECMRRFISFLERLHNLLEQLDDRSEELPVALATSLRGISGDLKRAEDDLLAVYCEKSRFFVLARCYELNRTVEDLTGSLGKWISLIPLAEVFDNHRELKSRFDELSSEMQHATYQMTEAEQRSLEALEKEINVERLNLAAAGGLWRDLARLIGMEPRTNSSTLQQQMEMLKKEVIRSKEGAEKKKMQNILKLFEQATDEPQLTRMYSYKENMEEAPLPPFDSFICPLTKQIMRDPVMIQSELTYEKSAIQKWFDTCMKEKREITCPMSGLPLSSTELRSNIMLRYTIEEWFVRNSRIRIQQALSRMNKEASLEDIEEALDGILKVCEDGPLTPYRLVKSSFIPSALSLWKRKMPEGFQARTKALIVFHRIAADDFDSQEALIEAGVLKIAVRALSSNQVTEVESAMQFLLEISKRPELAEIIGKEKGALIHILGISSNSSGNAALSVLAEKTLRNMEQVVSNVWEMAEAGRLEPLLGRLSTGPEETKIEMAKYLQDKVFVNSEKEHVARKAGKVLVRMLSGGPKAREAGLGALMNLSTLEDNVPVLVKAGILFPVVDILMTSLNPLRGTLKEYAATTLANIVNIPGSWESVTIDSEGNTMQSELFVHNILGLLSSVGPDWNSKLLKILIGIASSPQAADSVAKHMVTGNGIDTLLALLQRNKDIQNRVNVHKLLSVLSVRIGKNISQALVQGKHMDRLKDILKEKNGDDSIFAADIISNMPLTESETANLLGLEMLSWCLNTLEELKTRRLGTARATCAMLEGVIGVLLQFAKCSDKDVVDAMKQQKLMSKFKEYIEIHHGQPLAKCRAANGLGLLSERGFQISRTIGNRSKNHQKKSSLFGSCFSCLSDTSKSLTDLCPLHGRKCSLEYDLCLREIGGIRPLLELLNGEEQLTVEIMAIDALSTLVRDNMVEIGVKEIADSKGIETIMKWFQKLRGSSSSCSEAQEKGSYLVERILRVGEYAKIYSVDHVLVRSLVQVFKHGSPTARKYAEAALAHTDMLSVVSGGAPITRTPKRA